MQIQSVADILGPQAVPENQEVLSPSDDALDFSDHLEAFDSDESIEISAEPSDVETPQQPMTEFLQKMTAQLDVKPEKIVEAFAQLSDQDLAKPPEQNIAKLVDSLKLPPAQAETARSLFKDLLQKIEPLETDTAEKAETSDTLTALQALPFMTTPVVAPQIKSLVQPEETAKLQNPIERFAQTNTEVTDQMTEQPQDIKAAAPENTLKEAQFEIPQEMQLVEPDIRAQQAVSPQVIAQQVPVSTETKPDLKLVKQDTNVPELSEIKTMTAAQAPQIKSEFKEEATSDDELAQDEDNILTSDKFLASEGTKTQSTKSFSEVLKTGAPQAEKNIDEIINQSQILIKKGGGEMKVQLQPEGLGQVQLKISVQDGQVNVEMLTDSNDAKKAIEHSLQDLKIGLNSNQLDVGTIRVDVTRDASFNFDQQRPPPQRQMSENFNENLRQNSKQDFKEFQQRGYSPKIAASFLSQNNTMASRRLNLVA